MKKPLTNNIYGVTVKRCAWIYVEANSPEEAMKIAEHWTDEVDDEEFEDSEVEVDSCDAYASDADSTYMSTIYTKDEAIDVSDYIIRFDEQDPDCVGWDMTDQLELNLED